MRIVNEFICVNSVSQETGELHIEGDISDNKWWDEDVTPKEVASALKEVGNVKTLNVYVNSYGGSCVAGNSIVNIIDEYKKKNGCTVDVYIRGIAASMGSGIAMVGDKVSMANNALFMVHKPSTGVYGNANDLEKAAEVLDKVENALVKNYMRKFNGKEEELRDLMAKETWLNADEAKELGFVDEITEEVEIAASAKGLRIGDKVFNDSVADLIKNKYPNKDFNKKEDESKVYVYDEKFADFGVTEDAFKACNVEPEALMAVVNAVKDKFYTEPVEQFVDKAKACEALGCDELTEEELVDLAKAGKEAPENKAKAVKYEKIVSQARDEAVKNALRAQGENFKEDITKKMLAGLDYDDVVVMSESWKAQAKEVLNAGNRVSKADKAFEKDDNGNYINPNDFMI